MSESTTGLNQGESRASHAMSSRWATMHMVAALAAALVPSAQVCRYLKLSWRTVFRICVCSFELCKPPLYGLKSQYVWIDFRFIGSEGYAVHNWSHWQGFAPTVGMSAARILKPTVQPSFHVSPLPDFHAKDVIQTLQHILTHMNFLRSGPSLSFRPPLHPKSAV